MLCGFTFNESDQVLFKKKYVACFGSWNHEGEMLPFKPFKSIGNHGKRALHVRTFLANSIPVILQ